MFCSTSVCTILHMIIKSYSIWTGWVSSARIYKVEEIVGEEHLLLIPISIENDNFALLNQLLFINDIYTVTGSNFLLICLLSSLARKFLYSNV